MLLNAGDHVPVIPLIDVVGNAANVAPEQIVVALAAIPTLAGKFGFTVIVTVFDVAGEPVKHGLAFDVITTLTVFPLAKADVV